MIAPPLEVLACEEAPERHPLIHVEEPVDEQRVDDPAEHEQRDAQADEAVLHEPPGSLAVVGAGDEARRDQQEEAHEVGLIDRAEPAAESLRDGVLASLLVVPAAGPRIRDHEVVQDHEHGQEDPDVVDEEEPRGGDGGGDRLGLECYPGSDTDGGHRRGPPFRRSGARLHALAEGRRCQGCWRSGRSRLPRRRAPVTIARRSPRAS